MAVFEKEVEKLEKTHQELGGTEKLFDLPATLYPDLIKAQNDMKALKQIYEIYELQKVSITLRVHRHTYSCTDIQKRCGREEEAAFFSGYYQLLF